MGLDRFDPQGACASPGAPSPILVGQPELHITGCQTKAHPLATVLDTQRRKMTGVTRYLQTPQPGPLMIGPFVELHRLQPAPTVLLLGRWRSACKHHALRPDLK